jgi:flavin-dependent dehydrogenase
MSFIVGIIGGGIAGSTIALNLAKNGIKSVLIDESSSLVNGPPMCHLHAGGALYR